MAQTIRVLDENTINQIAAGEVIENPSSVVKELVDNAIDAKALEITVEIALGGRKKIQVTDNGTGMMQDDALLCLERHATSKIRSLEDMTALDTLGFRGEAIPSIASISHFSILTNAAEQSDAATFIKVQGGKILACSPSARAKGTTITVEHLFFNVPVRKKFQRSSSYDANEVQKVLAKLQLSHPEISISFISDGKCVFRGKQFSEEGALLFQKRAEQLFGKELLQAFVPTTLQKPPFGVTALLSPPSISRPTRSFQHMIVNSRPIYSQHISNWIREGYSTLLPEGRQPLFLLALTVPPDLIDVNVHPQKKEIRFRQQEVIRSIVMESVQQAFSQNKEEPSCQFEKRNESVHFSPSPLSFSSSSFSSSLAKEPSPPAHVQTDFSFQKTASSSASSPYNFITSVRGYLVVQPIQKSDELLFVDVGRAKQRIFFEESKNEEATASVQKLLLPETMQVPKEQVESLLRLLPLLHKSGFDIEQTGPANFSLKGINSLFAHHPLPALRSALLDLADLEIPSVQMLCDALSKKLLLSTPSRLSHFEASTLLRRLLHCEQTQYCPKGRPIFYSINPEKLQRLNP